MSDLDPAAIKYETNWDRSCLKCRAQPGQPCRRPNGDKYTTVYGGAKFHVARRNMNTMSDLDPGAIMAERLDLDKVLAFLNDVHERRVRLELPAPAPLLSIAYQLHAALAEAQEREQRVLATLASYNRQGITQSTPGPASRLMADLAVIVGWSWLGGPQVGAT